MKYLPDMKKTTTHTLGTVFTKLFRIRIKIRLKLKVFYYGLLLIPTIII